jgi:flagellar motility protein MotE (MotC chaperone)
MNRHTVDQHRDRITITRRRAEESRRPLMGWGKQIWSVGVRLAVIMALCWTMVQLSQDSSAQTTTLPGSRTALPVAVVPEGAPAQSLTAEETMTAGPEPSPTEPVQAQGPALNVPEEVVAMLQQRQEDLDRREKAVRTAEERFTILKTELERILSKIEAAEQQRGLKEQQEKGAAGQSAAQKKQAAELHNQKYAQLTKMYESMPAEEAAARIERMPDRKALEILRLVKGKTAGSILAQVKVDRAAKLTEQLLSNP